MWVGALTVCNGGDRITPGPCPRRLEIFVIRLRPRIGIFRTLSVLVLLAGLVGGVLISDRKSQHETTSSALAVEAAAAPDGAPDGTDRTADQKDAQTKADNAARAAA